MLRYSDLLCREMKARGYEVRVIAPQPFATRVYDRGVVGKWLGYIDKYLIFPLQLRAVARGWDWVHVCDHSNSMYLPHVDAARSSITCHDLLAVEAALQQHSMADVGRRVSLTGRVQQSWIRKHLVKARRVICVSHATERGLRALGADGVIVTIHNPLNRAFAPASADAVQAIRTRAGLAEGEAYLLHVGGNQWYKNRVGVLRIFAELRQRSDFAAMRLVMAGKDWNGEMHAALLALGLGDAVVELKNPSDAEVEALYTGCAAMLFPSLQEGFGWPIIEAQCCGALVVTSDRDPMREIAGETALLIAPADPAAAAAEIALRWSERAVLRAEGMRNAENYTTERLMPKYDEFFRQGAIA
ncbi:glycosyltransferase [Terriglobus roseus]|nr:glycosyltransferase [Terriglobus roseus]